MADLHDDLLRKAQVGDADAQYALGHAYHLGIGVARQLPVAMRWYLKAATQGHGDAQVSLGLMFLEDLAQAGMHRNADQARYWFRRAAESGDTRAMVHLARVLVDHNPQAHGAEAIAWLERAADAGHAPAQYELARLLRGAPGIEPDPLLALHYLHEAADRQHVPAMFALGLLLERGEGLDRTYPEQAAHWYARLAREHGHGDAAHHLGILHVEGRGVARSTQRATDMFQRAIALGCHEAMYSLALLHCAGGTPEAFQAAATWSILSQEYCPERGGNVLLAGLAGRLDGARMEAARQAAHAWKRQVHLDSAGNRRNQKAHALALDA